jgi:hypothetical protein
MVPSRRKSKLCGIRDKVCGKEKLTIRFDDWLAPGTAARYEASPTAGRAIRLCCPVVHAIDKARAYQFEELALPRFAF